MPSNEYDAEATELLETYGWCHISRCLLIFDFELKLADFLMKYIIIGTLLLVGKVLAKTLTLIGEAGTGKSCLLHHFTHNSCSSSMRFTGILFITNTDKDHSQHTIGVEFSSRTVKLGEKRIKLQVK